MFETTIAGSLPKPEWLAEPEKLWPQWKQAGASLLTNCKALPMVSATSSGVSITSDATSITPTITSFPFSKAIKSIGTCEWKHSRLTWLMLLLASAGNTFSY